ncbi:hypothetical protein [Paraburkholderia sp. IW21]|uniref:hypothetical protein n=1 Tax=Paraburkholderia sp. IW21 TaxID=3242488 RepID=UPI00352170EF
MSGANHLQQTVCPRKIPERKAGQYRVHAPQTRERPNISGKKHCVSCYIVNASRQKLKWRDSAMD